MRQRRTVQRSIFENYAEHEIGLRLEKISEILDEHPAILELVEQDFKGYSLNNTGRRGMSIESIFRCLLLKQELQISYDKLAFLLSDSISYPAFARLDGLAPKRSSLQNTIRQISPETLERVHLLIMKKWIDNGEVDCDRIRIDSTVTKSNIAPPSDSQLLNASIRVLSRLFAQSRHRTGIKIRFTDKRKAANSLAFRIFNAKKQEKDALYHDLLKIARVVDRQSDSAISKISPKGLSDEKTNNWLRKVKHYQHLLRKVMSQTERRVIHGKSVPSSEKIVSIFEEHTDIIVKGLRDVQYGHKINVSTIKNGFVTHMTIEDGNPKDSSLYLPVLKYHEDNFEVIPESSVCDGCYASQDNAKEAKEMGVRRPVFSKPVGLSLHDMGAKKKTFDRLRNFRAGVEANISELKRCFGLSKSSWKKREGFEAFVWSSVLSYNLVHMARLKME